MAGDAQDEAARLTTMLISLTADERRKFAEYLVQESQSDNELANQCLLIRQDVMAKKLRTEAAAEQIVVAKMLMTEGRR